MITNRAEKLCNNYQRKGCPITTYHFCLCTQKGSDVNVIVDNQHHQPLMHDITYEVSRSLSV